MKSNDLTRFFKRATSDLQFECDRIKQRSAEDTGTAGDNAEENWAQILREWIPEHFHVVTKGRIIGINGNCSKQIDILILSPYYPPILLNKKEYLSSGVIAAFECKLTLEAKHLRTAVKTKEQLKNIVEVDTTWNHTPFGCLFSPICYGILAHSHSWNGPDSDPVSNVNNNIITGLKEINLTHPHDMIDFICVADLATWSVAKILNYPEYTPNDNSSIDDTEKTFNTYNSIFVGLGIYQKANTSGKDKELFTPLGVLLKKLIIRMAYIDSSFQQIARYFNETKLEGMGMQQLFTTFDIKNCLPKETIEEQEEYLENNNYPGGKFSKWYTNYS